MYVSTEGFELVGRLPDDDLVGKMPQKTKANSMREALDIFGDEGFFCGTRLLMLLTVQGGSDPRLVSVLS